MERVLRGEADLVRAGALEGEQAKGQVEWGARDPARDLPGNVYVPAAVRPLPIRQDFPATSGAARSVGR